jgi:hypothetical protein
VYRWPRFEFTEISAGDLDIGIIGQLPAAQFAFGDKFEPGALKMVGFEAPLRRRGLREQALKDPSTDAYNAPLLADLNPEFDGHSVWVPPSILGECEEHGEPPLEQTFVQCSRMPNGDRDVESHEEVG